MVAVRERVSLTAFFLFCPVRFSSLSSGWVGCASGWGFCLRGCRCAWRARV